MLSQMAQPGAWIDVACTRLLGVSDQSAVFRLARLVAQLPPLQRDAFMGEIDSRG